MQLLQLRAYAFQQQDLYCNGCRRVARRNMAGRCGACAGPFLPRGSRETFVRGLAVFGSVAAYYRLPYLAEAPAAPSPSA